ncbi:S49 family peptidase [Inmirania thermothiophila]|uniref:Protease-4 n=1 Tax=Inmirania thermothiophila TaxID=1750597 RepID=A0A3N1Y1D3_9GAMM|nr:S49 family peptidase [Inmirania thermothiophila]ROR32644.1 protease-4 [Inmirania thermothiophila]
MSERKEPTLGRDPWREVTSAGGAGWERRALERLLMEGLREQRRARRWAYAFRFLVLAYVVAVTALLVAAAGAGVLEVAGGPYTAVVRLEGVISEDGGADLQAVVRGLEQALRDDDAAAVILRINSPGGSPVAAGQLYREIRRLRERHPDRHLYAVITDIGASGAYYVAAAAERIYADPASLVGSIGVRMDGFGFVEALRKLGIERRLLTAGEHKGMLDPFLPLRKDEQAHVQRMLRQIHEDFIAAVKAGRGGRLKDDTRIFSGLVWTGREALELGLVDGLMSPAEVAREVAGAERLRDVTPDDGILSRLAREVGAGAGEALARILAGAALPRG